MKLSSVWRLVLVILHRRSRRVGLVLSCVCFRANSVVLKMLSQAPGICCASRGKIELFLRDHPTPLTTAVATGPATVEYKQHRMYTAHVAAPPRVLPGVWSSSHLGGSRNINNFGGVRWDTSTSKERSIWMERPPRAGRDCGRYRPPRGQKLAASVVHC